MLFQFQILRTEFDEIVSSADNKKPLYCMLICEYLKIPKLKHIIDFVNNQFQLRQNMCINVNNSNAITKSKSSH